MKRLIWFYLVLIVGVFIALQINKDPGYVFISLGNYTIETPLWVAIIAIVLLFTFLYTLLRTIAKFLKIRGVLSRFFAKRSEAKAIKITEQGLIAFSEGRWTDAKSLLTKGLHKNKHPLVNFMISARAAEAQGDISARDKYLSQALTTIPDAKVAILLTQAQLQIASSQYEQAEATLNYIKELAPNHSYLNKMFIELYEHLEQWEKAQPMLSKLKNTNIYSLSQYERLEIKIYSKLFEMLVKERELVKLDEYYKHLPRTIRYQSDIVYQYCQGLLIQDRVELCDSTLKAALKKHYDGRLVKLYANIECKKISSKLSFLEGFLLPHPNCPHLLLALARLSYQLKLWGKTRSYLEKNLQISNDPKAIYELGRLHEALNENEKADKYYNQALNAVFNEPKDTIADR